MVKGMRSISPGTPILVSACLLGLPTRYDGKTKRSQAVIDFLQRKQLLPVPICPEQLAGMSTPRAKTCFLQGDGCDVLNGTGQVIAETGEVMNDVFCRGARLSLQIARVTGCRAALLKERSPSCGVHQIYRGQERVSGNGVTTALLLQEGLTIFSEEDL